MILDGAEVIAILKKDNFGVIRYSNNSMPPIPVKYLAICKYENDNSIFVFLCNENYEVEQDSLFDTVEEAKQYAVTRNKRVVWEDGIKYINFDDIDFLDREVKKICSFDQDMLEIYYPNGYMIDVGYVENIKSFVISIVKDNDWINIIKEFESRTDIEIKRELKEAIEWTNVQEK